MGKPTKRRSDEDEINKRKLFYAKFLLTSRAGLLAVRDYNDVLLLDPKGAEDQRENRLFRAYVQLMVPSACYAFLRLAATVSDRDRPMDGTEAEGLEVEWRNEFWKRWRRLTLESGISWFEEGNAPDRFFEPRLDELRRDILAGGVPGHVTKASNYGEQVVDLCDRTIRKFIADPDALRILREARRASLGRSTHPSPQSGQ